MQGSSGGASSLLYSAAVTVRFFDAVALALFARDLKERRFRILFTAKTRWMSASAVRTCGSTSLQGYWRYDFSGSDFRLADKTAVQFFVALRGR